MIYYIQELSIRFNNLKKGEGGGGQVEHGFYSIIYSIFYSIIYPTSLGTHHLLVVKKKIYKHTLN